MRVVVKKLLLVLVILFSLSGGKQSVEKRTKTWKDLTREEWTPCVENLFFAHAEAEASVDIDEIQKICMEEEGSIWSLK